ncbi:MAG: hypothetical protein J7497_03315 [Chitinophagaceae bacterium]|nr:hypothetical protein [Chitinophagaceae bacterium]
MKKIVFVVMLYALLIAACKKEHSQTIDNKDEPQVSFDLDGEEVEISYDDGQANESSVYSFGGYAGNYFGISSLFKMNGKVNLEITFGTVLTQSTQLTEDVLVQLIAPGKRVYGSLGAFETHPDLKPGKVEIAYTDKKSVRWCSTQIKEETSGSGLEIKVIVDQPKSTFNIDKIEKTRLNNGKDSYRIKGNFDCFVYQINSKAKKKMKGKFIGLIPL